MEIDLCDIIEHLKEIYNRLQDKLYKKSFKEVISFMKKAERAARRSDWYSALENIEPAIDILSKYDNRADSFFYENCDAISSCCTAAGAVYMKLGKPDTAINMFDKELKAKKHIFRPEHDCMAAAKANIAVALKAMNKPVEALNLLTEAADILYENAAEPIMLAKIYSEIGTIAFQIDDTDNAYEMFSGAISILRECRLIEHPDSISIGINIAAVLEKMQYTDLTAELSNSLLDVLNNYGGHYELKAALLTNAAVHHSKNPSMLFVAIDCLEQTLELYEKTLPPEHPKVVEHYVRLLISYHKSGQERRIFETIEKLAILLPKLYLSFLYINDDEFRNHRIKTFLSASNLFQVMTSAYNICTPGILYNVTLFTKDIGKEAEFAILEMNKKAALKHMETMNLDTVKKNLPNRCALIEYCSYLCEDAPPGIGGGYYKMFLLCNNEITVTPVGDADIISNLINAVRRKMLEYPHLNPCEEDIMKLRHMLIDPVLHKLDNVNHLFIAPDGVLFKLPFELIVGDVFEISYLTSGRDLTRLNRNYKRSKKKYNSVAIIADPAFSLEETDETGTGKRQIDGMTFFDRLPFTLEEARSIDVIFNGVKNKRLGADAKETVLKELGAHDIIHIATHGFYDSKNEAAESDPLMRCGLVFAGVNDLKRTHKHNLSARFGDGILYAREVLDLNLNGTELLVLSACDTGLGVTRSSDGIRGLRRVFELVGVQSVLCSLWEVSDLAASIFVKYFYESLIIDNAGKLQALAKAKNHVKNITWYEVKEQYGEQYNKLLDIDTLDMIHDNNDRIYTAPYYWAGFILQGGII